MPYDDSSIFVFLKTRLEYKSIYLSSYVHPNIIMKALQHIYQPLLYINEKVYMQPNWQGLTNFVNVSEANESLKKESK
jgi:hypothetical protein